MKEYINYDLYKNNTMRLHCVASYLYEPESNEELHQLVQKLRSSNENFKILGGGSNILMPEHVEKVISLRSIETDTFVEGNIVKAGASISIQKLIRTCQDHSLGGLEFLFTLPCQLGGAIYMNAGRGGQKSVSISDFVKNVTYMDSSTGVIHTISKEECLFAHRHSIFQGKNWIILSAELELEDKDPDIVHKGINGRLERSKKYLDSGKPSCGSVFCQYNSRIMSFLKGIRIGNAQYSNKTRNWISNNGNATYHDVLKLIRLAVFLHRLTFQKYEIEIIIWKQ